MNPQFDIRVAKFGGTSVADVERMRTAVRLVFKEMENHPGSRMVIVTSALGGLTDRLIAAIHAAEARTDEHKGILEEIGHRHLEIIDSAVLEQERDTRKEQLQTVLNELEELLQGIYLLRECTPRFADAVLSAGERMSAPILAALFRAEGHNAVDIDARNLIRTDDTFGEAVVDFPTTRELVREALSGVPEDAIPVITGFIGSTPEHVTTTLGRSGSDYTATLLGAALDASEVVIWTDVDGVLSVDPRIVPEAFTLPVLTYREAAELAHFGAKVLHPRTMRPLERERIPLVIRNTHNPAAEGTRIGSEGIVGAPVKAVTSIRDVALITLDGAGLIGVPDLTARAFDSLSQKDVSVLLIAQASSEGSLCFAVRERDRESAMRLLVREFERECERGDLHGIRSESGLAVIAAVGEGLRHHVGLAGRMFSTLARARVNVAAIAQGASDHNLSCVIQNSEAPLAVSALHESFALNRLRAHLVVIGTGGIAQRLLAMLQDQAKYLLENQRLNLQLIGMADSRRVLWQESGLPFGEAVERLTLKEGSGDVLTEITSRLREAHLERLIVIDATASEEVARRYPEWLEIGAAIVTPNQRAFTIESDVYNVVHTASRKAGIPLLYDATVGAGLSVLATLRDLLRTGDRVHQIEGVLSGTLAHVFAAIHNGQSFSNAVRDAAEKGLTEPDPRVDLSGEDVVRKLLLLAREMGRSVEPADVQVQSLVPEQLSSIPLDEFWKKLPLVDSFWEKKVAELKSRNRRLQFVALLADSQIRAGVQGLPLASPLAVSSGSPVVYAFHTDRFQSHPLVVQGPGAGRDVTASVLLADIVRAAEAMR